MQVQITEQRFLVTFDNIAEVGERVQAGGREKVRGVNNHALLTTMDGVADSGTMGLDKAIQTAINGGYWPEGAKRITPVDLDAHNLDALASMIPAREAAVIGYRVNVPAYLSGVPNCMIKKIRQPHQRKILRVAVNIGAGYRVEQRTTLNRGNAIMSVLDSLANLGYQIELYAVWSTGTRKASQGKGQNFHIETLIKGSDETWSPDSVAFTLTNNAYLRRLMFRVCDLAHRDHGAQSNIPQQIAGDCYGYASGGDLSSYDIAFDSELNNSNCDTPEKALAYVTQQVVAQLDSYAKAA
jgi:hypothetical protein